MSYITMEIWTGIWILVRFLPTALIVFAGVMIIELGIEFIQKKKIEVKILNWLCQFLWILIVVSILKITGIIGGSFGISSPLDSYISFKLFEDGFNAATILIYVYSFHMDFCQYLFLRISTSIGGMALYLEQYFRLA